MIGYISFPGIHALLHRSSSSSGHEADQQEARSRERIIPWNASQKPVQQSVPAFISLTGIIYK